MVSCLLPLASIYWTDELPDPDKMFFSFSDEVDRDYVVKLFAIRINYWNTGVMSENDQRFWENAKIQFPHWPLFQRLDLNETERQAHEATQNETENFFKAIAEEADGFTVTPTDNGTVSYTATFDLTKEKTKWWQFWK